MDSSLRFTEFDRFEFENWELIGEPVFLLGDTPLETYPAYGSPGTPPEGIRGVLKKTNGGEYGVFVQDEMKAVVTVSSYGREISQYFDRNVSPFLPRFNIGKQDVVLLER